MKAGSDFVSASHSASALSRQSTAAFASQVTENPVFQTGFWKCLEIFCNIVIPVFIRLESGQNGSTPSPWPAGLPAARDPIRPSSAALPPPGLRTSTAPDLQFVKQK